MILVGSLREETIWWKDSIGLWMIETDGVTRRLRSDGQDERIFRTLVEQEINLHLEVIPRSRFKRMVDGSSRTAFTHNFFARRELVYCADASIERWFDEANSVATRDREKELLVATTWLIHTRRHAEKLLVLRRDRTKAGHELIGAAYSLAALQVILRGEVFEEDLIDHALELEPDLFRVVYTDILAKAPARKKLEAALKLIHEYLEEHAEAHLKPLLHYLRKQKRVVPLSEIGDHFAHTQLYPWHLESACEWLERRGRLEKVSAPFKLTKASRIDVEEPAYFVDD